jgi:hypothetical protein
MANGSQETLAAVSGHSSTEVTRRYAHLRSERFRGVERRLPAGDLSDPGGEVLPRADPGTDGPMMTQRQQGDAALVGTFT